MHVCNCFSVASTLLLILFAYGAQRISAKSKCTLNNGRCTYRVQLLDTCENDIPGITERLDRSDSDPRLAQLEEKFSSSQSHCTKKMELLQKQIDDLTDLLFPNTDANSYRSSARGSYDNYAAAHSSDRSENEIEKDNLFTARSNSARRPENTLLKQVHDHFSDLRQELDDALRRLAAMEDQLRDSEDELQVSKGNLADAKQQLSESETRLSKLRDDLFVSQDIVDESNQQLLEAEKRLIKVENEKQILRRTLQKKESEIEETAQIADECAEKLRLLEKQAEALDDNHQSTRSELGRCHSQKETLSRTRDKALDDHHNLRAKHANVSAELEKTRTDLLECNDRKTMSYCGFEDPNLCGFTNEAYYDDIDWRQWSGSTPSRHTGPDEDHTCGNRRGQFMFVTSNVVRPNQRARFLSPKHRGVGEQCIEFYYYMYGAHVGILNVYFKVEGWVESDLPPPVWRAMGNQGQLWTMARLSAPVDVVREGYQVVFEARTHAGYEGDLALDDVRVFDGPCYGARTLEQVNAQRHNDQLNELNSIRRN